MFHDVSYIYWPWPAYKICFMLTCETCVSHYPSLFFVVFGNFKLLLPGFAGGFLAWMFTSACENKLLTWYSQGRLEKKKIEHDQTINGKLLDHNPVREVQ